MVAVDIASSPRFTFGQSKPLPIEGLPFTNPDAFVRYYDITPDGKQFVFVLPATSPVDSNRLAAQQINIVLNWFEELKQRVPAP